MTIKQILPRELIASVPSELKEQFHRHQLDTSVYRLKLLCVVLIAARIIHILLSLPSFLSRNVLDIFSELAQNPFYTISFVLLFYISVTYFSKKGINRIVWLLCHLFVIVNLSLSAFLMFLFGDYITLNFFWSTILLTLIPNFKPKVFLTLEIIYFVATISAIIYRYQIISFTFGDSKSFTIEIFVAITIIKVLLYNSDVKTFVKTLEAQSRLSLPVCTANALDGSVCWSNLRANIWNDFRVGNTCHFFSTGWYACLYGLTADVTGIVSLWSFYWLIKEKSDNIWFIGYWYDCGEDCLLNSFFIVWTFGCLYFCFSIC